ATARRAWTLPVLRIAHETRSFGELRSALRPVTDRALALCLQRLVAERLLHRDVDGSQRPPRVSYIGEGRGAALSDALQPSRRLLSAP
ncbi:MAG: winged helix-turn-helix transcriptional regulator, partial [Myxococcota bacterium]